MSRDWTPEEIQAVGQAMKAAGHMGFEEFCEELDRGGFALTENKEEKTMEDIYVYDIGKKPEEVIEGMDEIKAAIAAGIRYHQAKMEFERGEREFEDVPPNNPGEVDALRAKYPRAAAYMEAERWASSTTPIKARLGTIACERLLDGEDPFVVLDAMSKGLDAFFLAQEG